MSLAIQLGHPKIQPQCGGEFDSINTVLPTLFRPEEESVYLYWQQIPLRLRYQQDLPQCFDSLLAAVWMVQKAERGETFIDLQLAIVAVRCELRWHNGTVEIRGIFREYEELYGEYANTLNRQAPIAMAVTEFLVEWRMLLHQIIAVLKAAGVQIKDGTERRKWELLQRVEENIDGYGKYYRSIR